MHFSFTAIFLILTKISTSFEFDSIDLPSEHIPFYINAFKELKNKCLDDEHCPYKDYVNSNKCWGYERDCKIDRSYPIRPLCSGDHNGWVKSKQAQLDTFYTQADFGYIKEQLDEMLVLCEPLYVQDSSLECSKYLRFCRGRNLMLNFTSLKGRGDNLRYKMDILQSGQIGGFCKFYKHRLMDQAQHMSPLQSWGPEMVNFVETNNRPEAMCDVVINKPTYIMKIDATVNMYHHFCDFFNLYASLHINSTHPSMFSRDNNILVWETYTYRSAFSETFEAFTNNPIWDLKTFRGKILCFKNVVFPLLPRMIFGLYYNTPLIHGCERSGLFHAFSRHVLYSLKIPLHSRNNSKIRITLLSRETQYRRILNEKELINALMKNQEYEVQRVVYDRTVPFRKQLELTHNTDVFIGIHGAGLTHLLFLPDWAAIFELYNCEDPSCYLDLTRLRGLKYITWEDKSKLHQEDQGHHPEGGSHAKFTNYSFDVNEFLRLVTHAVEYVRRRSDYQEFIRQPKNNIKMEL